MTLPIIDEYDDDDGCDDDADNAAGVDVDVIATVVRLLIDDGDNFFRIKVSVIYIHLNRTY